MQTDEQAVEKLMVKDYEATLAFVDKLDGQLFAIRNLAIVSSSAVIAYSVSSHAPRIVLANAVVVPAFMLLELVYKCFHEDGIQRAWRLETWLPAVAKGGDWPKDYFFGIGHAIRPPALGRLFRLAVHGGRWHIRLLYFLLLSLSALAYGVASLAA